MFFALLLVIGLAACSDAQSSAEAKEGKGTGEINFPKKPINLIVPFAAGGGMDMLARGLAEVAPDHLDQPIVVINREGAGGTIGVAEGSKARPDGYTVTLSPSAVFTSQPHMRAVPYALEEFKVLAGIVYKPNVLVANVDSPYDSIEDIIKDAEKKGKSFKVGHPGVGSPGHLALETLFGGLELSFEGVPFAGNNPNITSLLGNHIDFSVAYTDEIQQHVKDKKLKVLGVFTPEQFEGISDVPTIGDEVAKAGYDFEFKDAAFATTLFVIAPKDTPDEIAKYLEEKLQDMGKDEKFAEIMKKTDIPLKVLNSEETKEILEDEEKVFKSLIETLGLGVK